MCTCVTLHFRNGVRAGHLWCGIVTWPSGGNLHARTMTMKFIGALVVWQHPWPSRGNLTKNDNKIHRASVSLQEACNEIHRASVVWQHHLAFRIRGNLTNDNEIHRGISWPSGGNLHAHTNDNGATMVWHTSLGLQEVICMHTQMTMKFNFIMAQANYIIHSQTCTNQWNYYGTGKH